jgi:hypothetical protein
VGEALVAVATFIAVGVLAVLMFLAIFVLATAITAGLVALVWNVLGLAGLFNAPHLTFWQVVAVAIGINILRSIFGRPIVAKD